MASRVLATIISMRDQFTAPARRIAGNTRAINREVQRTQNQIRRFGNQIKSTTVNAVKDTARIGAAFAGLAVGFAVKESLSQAMDLEGARLTLETVMKDSKKAKEMLTWGTEFANVTPFENKEITEGIVKLQSYGIEARKTLPAIGDMASVMGKSLDQGVEAIADAQTGQLERLKEFGISKDMIIAQAQKLRMGMVVNQKGQITDQKKFNEALFSLMNDKFKGGMEKQAGTLKGMWSTITGITGSALANIMGITADGTIKQGSLYAMIKDKIKLVGDTLTKWQNDGTIQRIAGQVTSSVLKMIEMFKIVYSIISTIYYFFKNNFSVIAPIVGAVVLAMTAYKAVMIASAIYTKAFAVMEAWKNTLLLAGVIRINAITLAQWAWNVAMTANPIGLIIAGIAALIVIGVLLYKNWDKVKLYCLSLWETVKKLFMTIWNNPFGKLVIAIIAVLNPLTWIIGLGVTLYKNWENIKLMAVFLWEKIMLLLNIFTGFGAILGTISWDFVAQKFQAIKDKVIALIEPLKNAVSWVRELFGSGDKTVEVKTEMVAGRKVAKMKKFALGGIATRPSIFGEAGAEMAIPLNNSERSKGLLSQANNIINKPAINAKTGNNSTIQLIIQGDIYGFNDFKEKVAKAMYEVIHIDGSNVAVAK